MITLTCDVGTGSVRVAIFEYLPPSRLKIEPLAIESHALTIYNRKPDFYEQKSTEIWSAFCQCASRCLAKANLDQLQNGNYCPIDAIAFTATCSLVIVGDNGDDEPDVIMWMDHRAKHEAHVISESNHSVLNQFGGVCSPEFSLSKLFWLFRNQRKRFETAQAFMELPDWLTYRCSQFWGNPEEFPRSLCSVTCKWGYDAINHRWPEDLFQSLGLDFKSLHKRIGAKTLAPGLRVGSLSKQVASEIGLIYLDTGSDSIESVSISSSLIDAHAGVVSMLVLSKQMDYENSFCMISGTSTCHMVLNRTKYETKGVWGPYLDVIIPGYYLREAGQSATGKLIEHVITDYCKHRTSQSSLNQIIHQLNEQLSTTDYQTTLIVNPTYHGNRSPIGNPHLKGAIYGFNFEEITLLDHYAATVEAIAYETKFIVEAIEKASDKRIERIIVSGGLSKNDFYLQLHADVLQIPLVTFGDSNLMLAGASMIAYTASTGEKIEAIQCDSESKIYHPRSDNFQYHEKKYKCYRRLLQCCLEMEQILSE